MKKFLIGALAISSVILTSCGISNTSNASDSRFDDDSVYIVTDYQTGCKYLAYGSFNQGGITSLLNSNGKTYCKNAK